MNIPQPATDYVWDESDPRPRATRGAGGQWVVAGRRCPACAYTTFHSETQCPLCGHATDVTSFGPGGTVFSGTVVRISVPGRTPPYGLAYVDLDDGPRILAHVVQHDHALNPRTRVCLAGPSDSGDPTVRLVSSESTT